MNDGTVVWRIPAPEGARPGTPVRRRLDDGVVLFTTWGAAVRASDGKVVAEGLPHLASGSPAVSDKAVYFCGSRSPGKPCPERGETDTRATGRGTDQSRRCRVRGESWCPESDGHDRARRRVREAVGECESWGRIWMAPRLADVTEQTTARLAEQDRAIARWPLYQAALSRLFVLGEPL